MLTKPDPIRQALAAIRREPAKAAAITAELDAQDAAKHAVAAAEAKQIADARERVERGIQDRAAAIAADYVEIEAEALAAAAEKLARQQLEAELGLVPWQALSMYGPPPAHLRQKDVDAARQRAAAAHPVAWDRKHRSAAELRAELLRDAAAATAAAAPKPIDRVAANAERGAKIQEQRQRTIAARKAAHGVAGYGDAA